MIDNLPSCLVCCKLSRGERGINKALDEMEVEIDVVEWIKNRRFINIALKKLLTKKERMEIKERVRYIMIDPDSIEYETDGQADRKLARLFTHVTNEAKINSKDNEVTAADLTDGFYTSSDESEQ